MKKPRLLTLLIKFYSLEWLTLLLKYLEYGIFRVTSKSFQRKESTTTLDQSPSLTSATPITGQHYQSSIGTVKIIRTYFVYILRSTKNGKFYIGLTDDLYHCFERHNAGQNPSTYDTRPFELIYYEPYIHYFDAKDREKYFKSDAGNRYIKKLLKHYFASQAPGNIRRILKVVSFVGVILVSLLLPSLLAIFYSPHGIDAAWYNTGWSKRKTITIDDAQVSGSSDLTNFPVLISLTDSDLAVSAQSDADDILFTSVDGSTKLDHEIERYTSGTGALVAWVEIPTLATATDTVIYMYYGNPSASNQENVTGTWNSNFAGVYHMAEDPSITTDGDCGGGTAEVCDSTSNNRDLDMFGSMPSGALISGGRVGSAIDFDGANDALVATGYDITETTAFTVSYWINPDTITQFDTHWTTDEDSADTAFYYDTNALTWCNSGSCGNFARTDTGVYTADTWHHVVAIYNGSGTATILINGVDETADSSLAESTETGAFVIGNWETGTNNEGTDGYIDEFKIATTNLSTDWAITEYNNQNSPSTFYSVGSQESSSNAVNTVVSPSMFWAMDEGVGSTLNDRTGNSNSGTITNAVWRTEDLCVSGKCLFFDGSGDFVSRASDTDFDFTYNGSISITGWFRHEPITSGTDMILARHNGAVDGGFKLYMESDGDITCGLDRDSTFSPEDSVTSTAATYDDNQWHHVACVKNSNTSLTLYIDGNSVGTPDTSLQSSGTYANTDTFYLGIDGDGSSNGFEGFLDEFKFFNGALSSAQIKADMASRGSFRGVAAQFGQQDTAFLNDGLVGYWPMDETAANSCTGGTNDNCDRSGNGNDAAWAASTADPSIASGKFGNGVDFDGDDYAEQTSPGLPTQDFTYSTWIYPDTISGTDPTILMAPNGSGGNELQIYLNSSVNDLRLNMDSISNVIDTTNNSISTGTWTHIAVTRSGRTISIYINGTLDVSTNTTASTLDFSTCSLLIGADADSCTGSFDNYFDGRIDDLRIYNRALSPAEVKNLYNWAPGPVGYWKMDEVSWTNNCSTDTVFDSSGNGLNGDACPNSTGPRGGVIGKFGNSGYFDGINDRVDVGDNNLLDLGNFSIGAWVNITGGQGTYRTFIAKGSEENYYLQTTDSNVFEFGFQDATTYQYIQSTTSPNLNTWYYVTSTFDTNNNLLKLYVNGVLEATDIITTEPRQTTTALTFGAVDTSDNIFTGYLDEIRIYNYARTPSQIVEDMNGGHPAGGSPVGSQALYWKFDEGFGTTANSAVSGKQNGTLGNMASPATATSGWNLSGKINNSLTFDGSNDVVTLATASDADVDFNSSEPFSLSSWIYVTTMPGSGERDLIVGKWEDDASPQRAYRLTVTNDDADTTGNLRAEVYDESADTMIGAATANDTISTNTWYHALMSFSGCTSSCPTSTVKVYLNGQDKGSSVTSGTFAGLEDMTADFTVGEYDTNDNAATDTPFTGRIDDVQVFSSELSSDSVQIVYNMNNAVNFGVGAPTPEPAQLSDGAGNPPVIWLPLDENKNNTCAGGTDDACDRSGLENNGALLGDAKWAVGKIGSAVAFRGATVNDTDAIDMGAVNIPVTTATYTIEAWINLRNTGFTNPIYCDENDNMFCFFVNSSLQLVLRANSVDATTATNAITQNTWNHVAVTYDGSSVYTLYVNGVNATTDSSASEISTAGNIKYIGHNNGSVESFTGRIDEFKIYDYVRTPAQVAYDYNRGAPVGWWKFDECTGTTAYDASGMGNNGTITIGATGSNDALGNCSSVDTTTAWYNGRNGKFSSALDFDGTDDSVTMTDALNPGTSDFTIALWAYPHNVADTVGTVFGQQNGTGTGRSWIEILNNGIFTNLAGSGQNFGFTPTNNTWVHIAVVHDNTGNIIRWYINGNLYGTRTSTSIESADGNYVIGDSKNGNEDFDGKVDDIRLFNYQLSATQIRNIVNEGSGVRFGPSTGSP